MEYEMEVEVFRAGDYGPRGSYSEDDLDRIAADYSKDVHEAPVTVDHQQEGPALGWIRSLRRAGNVLFARLGGLDGDFLEKLRSGAFKKRSVEFYRAAEATGRPYLRALTFLGAGAPVVKGLTDPVFGESGDTARIEFIEDHSAVREETDRDNNEGAPEPLREEQEEFRTDETEPSFEEKEGQNADDVDRDVLEFFERLRQQGRCLPVWERNGVARFMNGLDDAEPRLFCEIVKGDGAGGAEMTQRAWFRRFLQDLAPVVPMGELAPSAAETFSGRGDLAAPPVNSNGARFDDRSVALHKSVCRFLNANPRVSYAEALHAVASEL